MIDHWDLDHPFERLLVDTAVAPEKGTVSWINPRLRPGERRKVITGIPGKTGVVYTLDRTTGEFLWATPTVFQNIVLDIDGATGKPKANPEVVFERVGQEVRSCPGWIGGKDWEAGAYSPLTNTMYYPLRNACGMVRATEKGGGLPLYRLAVKIEKTPGSEVIGTVRAISAETGKTVWLHEQRAGTTSLMTTGGGLVFGGDVNGRFHAFDQKSGQVLWEINLGSPVTGFPISFAVDGRQYVAVSTRECRHRVELSAPDARAAAERRQQPVRLRAAGEEEVGQSAGGCPEFLLDLRHLTRPRASARRGRLYIRSRTGGFSRKRRAICRRTWRR